MSDIRGWLDPEARAALDAVLAKWAAPGMCIPDDENPCVDGDASVEAVTSDGRSTGQRNHDALKALCRAMLASGQLGSHKGLPVTMVISTTLAELESGKGHAVTGGGSSAADVGGDPPGRRGSPLPVGVRLSHRRTALPRP